MYIYTKAHFSVDINRSLSKYKPNPFKNERASSFKKSSIIFEDNGITVPPQLTPYPTPSVTPSVTPSISVTPSVTPSITPSVTPSITPSVMPNDAILLDDGSYLLVGYNEYLKFIDP